MNAQLNIVVLGGTGFIGRHLLKKLSDLGHRVHVYGRQAFSSESELERAVSGCDVLIMLAGANIGQRWTKAHKQALWDSRLQTNNMLARVLQRCEAPPERIFSASAIGIYPERACSHPVDESCTEIGDNVLGELGAAWEEASHTLKPEPLIFRFGVVLGEDGGALQKMLPAFRLGLGGPVGSGDQCFSWVHIDDLVAAFVFALQHPDMQGVYNLTSPQPVTNRAFGRTLSRTLGRPFWLPLPEWQLKLMFGEGAQVLTHSSSVVPTRLLEAGFQFRYPEVSSALSALLKS